MWCRVVPVSPVVQVTALQINLCSQIYFLKISDVGQEEADEGEGQKPFRDCADNVSRVTRLSRSPVKFARYVNTYQTGVHDDWRYKHADDAAQGPESDAEAQQVDGPAVDVGLHAVGEHRLKQDVKSPEPKGENRPHEVHVEQGGLLEVSHHAHPEGAGPAHPEPDAVQSEEFEIVHIQQSLHLFVTHVHRGHT